MEDRDRQKPYLAQDTPGMKAVVNQRVLRKSITYTRVVLSPSWIGFLVIMDTFTEMLLINHLMRAKLAGLSSC